MDPNCASFKLKRSLIVGILDAHDEKHNPDKKKYVLNAIRCKFLVSMFYLDNKNNLYLYPYHIKKAGKCQLYIIV
jgi:hypothetical protein